MAPSLFGFYSSRNLGLMTRKREPALTGRSGLTLSLEASPAHSGLRAEPYVSTAALQTAVLPTLPALATQLQIFLRDMSADNSPCARVCVSAASGHNDTVWKNKVLCLPLSYFSSSALPPCRFHRRVRSVTARLGPVVSPRPAIIGNTASRFHTLFHFHC